MFRRLGLASDSFEDYLIALEKLVDRLGRDQREEFGRIADELVRPFMPWVHQRASEWR